MDPIKQKYDDARRTSSPLILDLNGDGIQTTGLDNGTYFDHDKNGFSEQTGWVSPGDGLLVRDLNGDGQIDSGRELFGNQTRLTNGANAANGFDALAELDGNHDGKIDAQDSVWASLQVWQDTNGDGLSQANELHGLDQAGVQSISTGYNTDATPYDPQGNAHKQIGAYTTTTGETRAAEDVWFQVDKTYTIATEWLDVPETIAALPDLAGYGNVHDLHQAMVRDTTGELTTLVEQFGTETTQAGRESLFEQILFKWTGADGYAANSRGGNIDGRKLYAVEAIMGEPFVQYANSAYSTPNPGHNAAYTLNEVYSDLYESNLGNLMAQTHLKGLYEGIVYAYDETTQTVQGDLDAVAAALTTAIQANHSEGLQTLKDFTRSLDGMGVIDMMDYTQFRQDLYALGADVVEVMESHLDTINGSVGSQTLVSYSEISTGASKDEIFQGMSGDDVLKGGRGSDVYVFNAGDGHDRIVESTLAAGDTDTLRFGAGISVDQIHFAVRESQNGVGDPTEELVLEYNGGADSIAFGSVGEYWQSGMHAVERIEFDDLAQGWDFESVMGMVGVQPGSETADLLHGAGGNDTIDAKGGNDYLMASDGNDVLIGGQGNDWLDGGQGDDTYVFGLGDGKDVVRDAGGVDMIQFGANIATSDVRVSRTATDLSFQVEASGARVTVQDYFVQDGNRIEQTTFADNTVWTEADWLAKARESTTGDDYLDGADTAETLTGQAGDDEIFGNGGDDTLDGGAGNDVLAGGAGNDTYLFGRGYGQDIAYDQDTTAGNLDRVQMAADVSAEEVSVGREGNDLTLSINGATDKLSLQGWFERADNRIEQVEFGNGVTLDAETLRSAAMDGDENHDTLEGFRTDDEIHGKAGNDTIHGLDGNDTLHGDGGFDILFGGAGNDLLDGGTGDDTLDGGAGNDTYRWGWGDGIDHIRLSEGLDTVLLRDSVQSSDVWLSRGNMDLVLERRYETGIPSDLLVLDNFFSDDNPTSHYNPIQFSAEPNVTWSVDDIKNRLIQATDSSDTILGYGSADVLEGKGGNDYIDGYEGDDRISGDQGNDTLKGGAGADTLNGDEGVDVLEGGAGNDVLAGDIGNDTLNGGAGDDTYLFGRGDGQDFIENNGVLADETDSIRLDEGIQADAVSLYRHGDDLALVLDGSSTQIWAKNAFDASGKQRIDQIQFADGTVWSETDMAGLTQSGSANSMTGTAGDDVFDVDNLSDTISESAGQGVDTVQTWLTHTLGNNLENLTLTGALNVNATGNNLDNVIRGNSANNVLDGGGMLNGWGNDGRDTLIGGGGDDTYYVTPTLGDEVIELAGEGNDTVIANFGYTLADNVENLIIHSSSNSPLTATGNALDNVMTGRSDTVAYIDQYGHFVGDTIDGGAGADTMTLANGGTFYVDNLGDRVQGGGNQRIFSTVDFSLGEYAGGGYPQISELTLMTDAGDISATGNGGANTLNGNNGNNILNGGGGVDLLSGGGGSDTLIGGAGSDTYVIMGGNPDDQDVIDNAASDGESAIDTLEMKISGYLGRVGDDLLIATGERSGVTVRNHFSQDGSGRIDQIKLNTGTVLSGSQIDENLTALEQFGTEGEDSLVGTWFGDTLHGGEGGDTLSGVSGNDRLLGEGGNDHLYGGTGSDHLEGGQGDDRLEDEDGADTLQGGAGNDWLAGSYGDDLYLFARGDGVDIISDYDDTAGNVDTVRFDDTVASNEIRITRDWDNLYLSVDGTEDRIQLESWLTDESRKIERVEFADGTTWNGDDLLARLSIAESTEGDDALFGASGGNIIHGLGGFDSLIGQGGNDALYGDADDDMLFGEGGNDRLDGGSGADTLEGGAGDDTYLVDDVGDVMTENLNEGVDTVQSAITLTLGANLENLTLTGSSAINGTGNSLNNVITGNSAANVLKGGAGNDTYYVGAGDTVTESSSQGTDTVISEATWTLGSNLENLTLTGSTAINGTGNTLANTLVGNNANNTLSGGTGADTMAGGMGNDSYVVDNTADAIIENADEGTDAVSSSVTYTLSANLENLTLTGTSAIHATGNALDNTLTGNSAANTLTGGAGNDRLDGKGGADKMLGGTGNDIYVVDKTTDVITENANEGTDTVESSVTLTLGANVENLTLTGTTAINATGNTLDNALTGNSAANILTGGAGSDRLDGGAGNDTMKGGSGNDTYVVGSTGDIVTENANEGTDTVESSVTLTLGTNVENLTLTGTTAINATGNTLNNVLTGNTANNTLSGSSGNDALAGGAGADTLTGGSGNDILMGGLGNDTLATTSGADLILYNAGDGTDTLSASGSGGAVSLGGGLTLAQLNLSKNASNLVLGMSGSDAIIFKDWYAATPQRGVVTLQMVQQASQTTADDPLDDNLVETYDFQGIASEFDSALATTPGLSNWSIAQAVSDFHTGGSDTQALGGDAAYGYGTGLTPTSTTLTTAASASPIEGTLIAQTMTPPVGLSEGVVKL